MTINFSFFSFFVLMIHILQATTHAIDDLPDWSTTPYVRIVLKRGGLLVQRLFMSFLSKKRVWLKSVPLMSARKGVMVQRIADTIFISKKGLWLERFPRNGQFLVNVPQRINQGDFRVLRFWDLYFWSLKGFSRFETIASLGAYQIIKNQILQNSFFCCLIFEEFEKEFLNQEFYHSLSKQAWSKSSLIFSKLYPSRY